MNAEIQSGTPTRHNIAVLLVNDVLCLNFLFSSNRCTIALHKAKIEQQTYKNDFINIYLLGVCTVDARHLNSGSTVAVELTNGL